MVLNTNDNNDGFDYLQMDILENRMLSVDQTFVIGHHPQSQSSGGNSEAVAVVYVGNGATATVGGDLVVGGSAADDGSTNSDSNGVLILAGNNTTLSIIGTLRIGEGGSNFNESSANDCGLGTVDASGGTQQGAATITADDLHICDNNSKLILARGNSLTLQTDRRDRLNALIADSLIVLKSSKKSSGGVDG
eukprot:CAMPEP_0201135166 /NCGR_PEP_ID=MMETSP0850-20130426/53779_1 /ASSEMBLY_ACC=CAM_ASM_000622 /TAXON_ID=183588 /ORGANISM="Pseudo-nitzschia fraudulenta, Strain WWA7" /LENGTH=191 /DNA_ID=CAMNT_0047406295 /DNA_START=22 /DNA_END=594 /DNA_ORIENTATION=+